MVMFNSSLLLAGLGARGVPAVAYRHSTRMRWRSNRGFRTAARAFVRGLFVTGAILALLGGCSGGRAPELGAAAGSTGEAMIVPARDAWRDMDAAVARATGEQGLAVLSSKENAATGEKRYELVSVADEPGELLARAPEGFIATDAPTARVVGVRDAALTCRIGRFGSAERERALMDAVRGWRAKHTR